MKCPSCSSEMTQQHLGGISLDVCSNGCKSIWFDWMELDKMDEKHEDIGQLLKEALDTERAKDNNRGQINCPKCSKPMKAHLYKSAKEVTVDECYICGGFFLDSGELQVIRECFMDEQTREVYFKKILASTPEAFNAQANLEKNQRRVEGLQKMTKIFRLSDNLGLFGGK